MTAERSRIHASDSIARTYDRFGDQAIALSAVAFTELLHGLHRETDPARRARRELFFADLYLLVPIIPYDEHIARLAARIGAEQASIGLTIPPVDLMIGATALHLNFSILTTNERHFRLILGLQVIPF